MKKPLLFTLMVSVILSMALPMYAVLADYNFTSSVGTYTEITGGTLLGNETSDDQRFVDPAAPLGGTSVMTGVGFPIGFNFALNDYVFDVIAVCNNGWISFGQSALGATAVNITSTSSYNPLSSTSVITPPQLASRAAGLARDLQAQVGSTLRIETTGAAPNRICVVQWKNYKRFSTTGTGDIYNFQIQLHETTNQVVLAYGAFTNNATATTVQVGLRCSDATDFINRTNTTDWTSTTAGATNAATCALTSTNYPPNGLNFVFSPPVAVPNDLQAMSISGSTTPSSGTLTPYTISVRNRGSNPQTTYSVKLMSGTAELASVAGPALAAGEIIPVVVNWTPVATGPMQLTGKVVLAGDQNPANDITAPLDIIVQPAGTNLVIIGTGTSTQRQPFGIFWGFERDASLYTQEQIGTFGTITSIQWYCATTAAATVPYNIYIKTTTETALTAVPWATMVADAQIIATGTQAFNQVGWITFPLTVPYTYSGGNLVVMVETFYGGTGTSPYPYFQYSTGAAGSHQFWYADTTPPSGNGTLNTSLPNIGLSLSAVVQVPQFAVTPLSYNYGQVFINTTVNKTFTIVNTGGGTAPLIINSITISGSPFFTLQNLPTLPASLASFQNTTFVARYSPTVAGAQSATITITDNLTRTAHPVEITGTCVDPTIYTPPYVQNFDGVTTPNLPIDWSKLIVSTTSANATTSTTTPHSIPNCVYMTNSTDATAGVYLISPPLANALPLVTMRVKFWAKGSTNYTLSVGVIADPADAATYSEVANQTLTSTWTEYVVGFQTYAGQGHFIAFKHGLGGTSRSIYIDDVTIEVTPQNDLAALSLAGITIPVVGVQTPVTVNLFNWGTNPQNNYSVKLYNTDNLELASTAGPQIEPGASAQATINWTPTTAGAVSVYGKVVLIGDQNNLNDQTPSRSIVVQPAGTIVFTVGDGSQTARMPVDMYYKNSLFETIFPAGEILGGGNLNSIAFYNNFLTTTLTNKPTKIWLGLTEQTDLSSGWIPSTQLTSVFDGNVDYPAGQNMITIPLQTPFPYVGGNLVMLVNRPLDTAYFSSSDLFYGQTVGTNRSRNIYSDSTPYDPAAPPATGGTNTGQFPLTTFFFTATTTEPQFAISPQSYTYPLCFMNTMTNKSFNMMNIGGGTLIISSITISGSPFFSLQNLPTLPVSMTSGQSSTFVARYNPTAAGTHTATITITDNLGRSYTYSVSKSVRDAASRTQHPVQLTGTCIDPVIYNPPYVQNFDAVTVPNLPIDWSKLVVSTAAANVTTSTTLPHSAPNTVYLTNSTDASAGVYLISPPITNTIPMVTMRVKFWAKGGTNYTLGVGIIADPTDAATYSEVASQILTSAWAEYVISFQTYAGQGHYIAFKHGLGGTSRSIYIDDVTIEVTPQNDLAALTVAGNITPSVGVASAYTISLFNWGTSAQSNYQVKLYNSNNLELASVSGPLIESGMAAQVPVSWTPTLEGDVAIYGKVILAGDQNNLNDQTPNYNVSVQPAGTIVVTIGSGTSTQRQPIGILYGYERDATLYTAENIGTMGAVNGIRWYCGTTATGAVPYRILLKTTTETALVATPWATMVADAQLMAEGTYTFSQTGWVNFAFEIPFVYAGGNLVVLVETNYGGGGTTSPAFRYTVGPTGCHQYWYADTTAPSGNGYLNTSRPNIGISLSAVDPNNPQFAIAPQSHNFGQVFINTINNKNFNVINVGGGTNPLIINSITITGSTFFTLQNLPTIPVSLVSFQSTSFVARYNPTEIGNHTATITVTDNLGRSSSFGLTSSNREAGASRLAHPVQISGSCIDPTIYTPPYSQNFDTVTVPALPIDWSKLAISTSAANITTVTTSPRSTPNCVLMTNSTDTNASVILVSPPIATNLPLNTMRIKFWAKATAGYTLNLGVLVSPTDANSFVQTSSVTLTAAWAEYVVAFQTYTGQGHYIGLKHGLGGSSRSIYIDDVTIEVTPQNDLAALTVTGNSTPSVGMSFNYTVNLYNWGTNPQNTYTVKLFKEGDVEIGSVAGTPIEAGATAQAVISWTPVVQGLTYIYGKVVLTGDQNNLNDQTPNFNVGVQPAGVMVVTVGEGNQNARMPMDFYFKNSLNETIYLASELNFLGLITGISFYNNFYDDRQNMPTKVWMGTTTQTDLSAGWIPSTALTSVFDGTVSYPIGQNVVSITFPQPFLYLEGNLVVMFNRPMDTAYYSSQDYFYCQTVGTNRARNIYSDSAVYDPAAPPTTGTPTGQFAKTSFFVIPGGVGHLTGNVYGAGNVPLNNATVQIVNGGQSTTNEQGHYLIQNIVAGTYQVTVSRFGYVSQTLTVIIPEDSTVTQNFTLTQMPTVNVTGTIVGSDLPATGLSGAIINLTGMENYTATTNTQGNFTIVGVYANQSYEYQASAVGYQNATGTVNVGAINHSMGTIMVNEIAYAPRNVSAEQNTAHTNVTVGWLAPDPDAVDITQSFESATFPPTDWTRIVTDNNPAGPNGVYPTWCRFGTVVDVTTTVIPTDGQWQCGFWWDYNHQDEWLITPQFNCPQGANLIFDSYVYRGSTNGDHYYVKVTANNGADWTVLWDASALTGGLNNYQTPIQIDLSAFAGQQVKIAWHADDPPDNQGMWYNWFIDNVVISNTVTTIKFNEDEIVTKTASAKTSQPQVIYSDRPMARPSGRTAVTFDNLSGTISVNNNVREHSRTLLGYKVWRLLQGQEQNETTWTLLTPAMITTLSYLDESWVTVATGTYKWAIKAVYTSDVLSLGVFSNAVVKEAVPTGTLVGVVRNQNNYPVMGATITAGQFTTTTVANGGYNLQLPADIYTVTCSAPTYNTQTQLNVLISVNQTTTVNFTLTPVTNIDEVQVLTTTLNGNYPNPFNPETTISYDVKNSAPVKIEIFNTKGQLIRTLVNETKTKGRYLIAWNGKDNNGNPVASGVYQYRMRAGDYKSTRMMMLMK